jgi:hypothetical protein
MRVSGVGKASDPNTISGEVCAGGRDLGTPTGRSITTTFQEGEVTRLSLGLQRSWRSGEKSSTA